MKTNTSNPSSNVFLFYGEDDFSIKRKIDFWKDEFTKKYSGSAIIFFDGEKLAENDLLKKFEETLAPSLFSSKKFIIAKNCLPTKAAQEILAEGLVSIVEKIPTGYFLVFWQTQKLDQRLKIIKKILSLPIKQTEFKLPHGTELNRWILAEISRLGAAADKEAVETLAQFLGRDLAEEKKAGGRVIETKEVFDLWQAANEIEKLVGYNKRVTKDQVLKLIKPKMPENVFALSDSIINHQEKQAFDFLEQLLSSAASDEKSSIIKIVGLLTEQLKSLVHVKLLTDQSKNQDEMAEILGWSSGRVFINMKLSKNLSILKGKQLLGALLKIDKQLKNSESDPRLLINLFIHQACS